MLYVDGLQNVLKNRVDEPSDTSPICCEFIGRAAAFSRLHGFVQLTIDVKEYLAHIFCRLNICYQR